MPQISLGFDVPGSLHDMLGMLNGSDSHLRLSLVDQDGRVYGHLAEAFGQEAVESGVGDGLIRILQGSADDTVVLYASDSPEGTAAFLYGGFYGVFRGKRLEDIHNTVVLPYEVPPA